MRRVGSFSKRFLKQNASHIATGEEKNMAKRKAEKNRDKSDADSETEKNGSGRSK